MGQRHTNHIVICIDEDVETEAKAVVENDGLKNKGVASELVKWYKVTNDAAARTDVLDALGRRGTPIAVDAGSKITVVGHGQEDAQSISLRLLSPLSFAKLITALLNGTRIKRISLLQCRAGGFVQKFTYKSANIVKISPADSFAHEFASYAGNLTQTITARTGTVNLNVGLSATSGAMLDAKIMVRSGNTEREHHGDMRKVVITPDPVSSIGNKRPPTWKYESYQGLTSGPW